LDHGDQERYISEAILLWVEEERTAQKQAEDKKPTQADTPREIEERTTMKPRYIPFIVDHQQLDADGSQDTGFFFVDFVGDRHQGLGRPARTVLISNDGDHPIQFQLCDKNGNWSSPKTLRPGIRLTYCTGDGLYVTRMKAWSPGNDVGFISIDAMPGNPRMPR